MINLAKGIYFLQTYLPDEFSKTKTILNFPSYWSFELTGIAGAEPTYMGCHTYLWDHAKSDYSPVTERLGIRALLPKNYRPSYETLGKIKPGLALETGLSPDTIVTMGIHDSNASLLPYLVKEGTANKPSADYIINSTGTWCVLMHPQDSLEFGEGDLGNIVFFNQCALKKPVKTAIFLGGMELDSYISIYKQVNNTDEFPRYNPDAFRKLIREKNIFLFPEIVPGSGQFNSSEAGILENGNFFPFAQAGKSSVIKNGELLWAVIDVSLVIQTIVALERTGLSNGMRIFTEGGFRKNKGYNTLLSSALPKNKVFLTNLSEATSFGAAMTALMALTKSNSVEKDLVDIEYIEVEKEDATDFDAYRKEWLKLAVRRGN
jgi:sugar (pentulose or hexulose) kinase